MNNEVSLPWSRIFLERLSSKELVIKSATKIKELRVSGNRLTLDNISHSLQQIETVNAGKLVAPLLVSLESLKASIPRLYSGITKLEIVNNKPKPEPKSKKPKKNPIRSAEAYDL